MYIKYDKNLIVKCEDFEIANQKINLNASLDYVDNHILINLKEVDYKNHNLKFSALSTITLEELIQIKNAQKNNLKLDNVNFIFDTHLKSLKAQSVDLNLKKNDLYISLKKASYDGIKLDENSSAVLYELNKDITLELKLFSKNIFNEKIKKLLSYYKITIPIIQKNGNNNSYINLKLPFKHMDDMYVYVKSDINNSTVLYDDKVFRVDDAVLEFKDNRLNLKSSSGSILVKELLLSYENLELFLHKEVLNIKTNIEDSLKNKYFYKGQTNINTQVTKGNLVIKKFQYKHYASVENKKLDFTFKIKKDKTLLLESDKLQLKYIQNNTNKQLFIKKFDTIVKYLNFVKNSKKKNKIKQASLSLSSKDDFKTIDIKMDDLDLDINSSKLFVKDDQNSSSDLPILDIKIKNSTIGYDGLKLAYNEINVQTDDKLITYQSRFKDTQNNKFGIRGIYDVKKKSTNGDFIFLDYSYKNIIGLKSAVFDFNVHFDNDLFIESKKLNLSYTKSQNKHKLNIKNLDNLIKYAPNIHKNNDTNSSLQLTTQDNFKQISLTLNNIFIDINSSSLEFTNKDSQNDNSSALYVKAFDSMIKYDNFFVDSSVIELNNIEKKLNLQIIPYDKKGSFFINKFNDDVKIKAIDISNKFVNKLLQTNKFTKGVFSIDLNGTMEHLNGKINLQKVNIKNVRVINNLITFINTTPAIYNPLLTLPTLYRMGQQGFNTNGYYVKKGHIDLDIDVVDKKLQIPSFFTRGVMTDFEGKGVIDFMNKKQEYNIDIIFLKDYSNVIKHIPIVNYIILGDSGNFVTQVDIKGDFAKQAFETHAIKDTSQGIFDVIKRTISIPFLPFMGDSNSSKENN